MIEVRTIEQLCQPKSIRYGVVQPGKHDPEGVPMLNSGDISNGFVDAPPSFKVKNEVSNKHRRSILKGGELLVTLVGTPGITAIAPASVKDFNVSRAIGVLDLLPEVDARYVMYALQTPEAQFQIKVRLNTTVQPTFNLSELKNIEIPVPGLLEQKSISRHLSMIDKKIQLNQKMHQTLEEIA